MNLHTYYGMDKCMAFHSLVYLTSRWQAEEKEKAKATPPNTESFFQPISDFGSDSLLHHNRGCS
jgi:hypothetical protein